MLNANVTITAGENQEVTWNSINWKQVNSQVNNLRKRIYRASCDGNMKLVSSLQKLTFSYIMFLMEKMGL